MSPVMLTATLCGLLGGVPAAPLPFASDDDYDDDFPPGVAYYEGAMPYPGDYYGYGFGYDVGPYYPYDAYETWIHGYYVELPVYGGYAFFRPYNWRDVPVHSHLAYSWGLNPALPYSQEYFLRSPHQQLAPPAPVVPHAERPSSPSSTSAASLPYGAIQTSGYAVPAAPAPRLASDRELDALREIIERQARQIDALQRQQ